MQAMPQAQALLSSSLPAQHSAISSLFWLTKQKKWLHYTLNTLHQTLHNTLTIQSKHAICHKSLKTCCLCRCLCHHHYCCQFSAAVPPTTSPVPQQPNHVVCHIILWLGHVVPFSTYRNVFFCLQTLPGCRHFHDKIPFLPFLPTPDTKQTWWQC